ncbi:SDR family NAD(P)-dependent oxidoreductase [Sphingomonas sp. M1-B02]|uniref:SDR family NAD(P)-dependent oxidoreductase n=1 Tax=Sphingomonas sp. M1-B02 TaxID=3114300 RepID=UPI002240617D|nr:SDR family NAD(P)-dependent oxidoreductase [Sphingomonas sp. S6-11]UZK67272.1 SDR family oxidoreductase [Sphingomonas sp. S6-11]
MMRLAGKTALVTGAASGIGRACAQLMAEQGAHLFLGDVDDAAGRAETAALEAAGFGATYLNLNVASEAYWQAAARAVREQAGRLDILVNNAGIGIGGPIEDLSLEDWRRQQAVNLDGPFLGIKHCLPLMREGGGGSIVNIASVTGIRGSGVFVSYAASKGGLLAFTRAMAKQCAAARDGVRVNAVAPGVIETPIFARLEGVPGNAADAAATAARLVPLGHAGTPEDVAHGVLYLASDEARYVTGTELVIDGGLLIG